MNPWEATHPVSIEKAKQKVALFKELLPLTIEPIGTGFDHTVYNVNNDWAFRFPRRKMGFEAMQIEVNVLQQLVHHPLLISIPKPEFYGEETTDDYPFAGFSLVHGNVLTDEGDIDFLKHDVERLALFLKELHQRNISAPEDHLDRLSIKKRKPILKEAIREVESALPRALHRELNTFIENVTEQENPVCQSFVHGDLHPKNIIVQNVHISGIIDWGDAHIGHPAVDLAVIYMVLNPKERDKFYQFYDEVDPKMEELARFRALFTSVMLLQYALDADDVNVKLWAVTGIKKALR